MTPAVVVAEDRPGHLVAMMLVQGGRLAVFANTRLTDERSVVVWAERMAGAGEIVEIWWEDDPTT